MLEVKMLEKSLLNDDDAVVFYENQFLELNPNIKVLHIYENGQLISIIPIEIKKKFIFKIGKLLYEPYPLNSREILDAVIIFLGNHKIVDFLIATPNYIPFKYVPRGSTYCDFGSYRIDLKEDEEQLFKNLHSKHRNVIKKCQKEALKIVSNDINSMKDCFNLFKETMSRSSMAYPSYNELSEKFEQLPNNIYFSIVYKDNIPQGALYLYYNRKRAYYIYGGSIEKPFTGAMNFLHWDAMITLKRNNVESYDFVGARISPIKASKTEGIQKFKERFGSKMYRGYMWKYIFNQPKYYLYLFLLRISYLRNKTKYTGDIIDQENSK